MSDKDNARLYVVDGNTAVKNTQPFGDNAAKFVDAGYIVVPVGLEVKPNGAIEFYRLPFDDVPSVDSLNLPSVDDAFPDLKALEG